ARRGPERARRRRRPPRSRPQEGLVKTVVVATRKVCLLPEFPGNTWSHMQWVLGLQRLGLRTVWIDHVTRLDPRRHPHSIEYVVREFERTARDFGFEGRWAIVLGAKEERVFGMSPEELRATVDAADLLLNISKTL